MSSSKLSNEELFKYIDEILTVYDELVNDLISKVEDGNSEFDKLKEENELLNSKLESITNLLISMDAQITQIRSNSVVRIQESQMSDLLSDIKKLLDFRNIEEPVNNNEDDIDNECEEIDLAQEKSKDD